MKRLLILISMFVLSAVLCAQSEDLMKYVPADVDGFACVNMKELSAYPKFKEMIDTNPDPEMAQFKDDLTQAGIDIYDAFGNGVIFYNSKTRIGGGVMKTKIEEATFSKLLDNRAQGATPVKKTAIDGKTYYVFEKGGQKTTMVYLKPDTIGFTDKPENATKFSSLAATENVTSNSKLMGYAAKVDKKAPLWAVFVTDIKLPNSGQNQEGGDNNPVQQMFPVDNIQGGLLSINFTGETKDTVNLNLRVNCKEKMKAQILTLQVQTLTVTYIPMLSKGNEALSGQLMKAINFANEENDIVIKVEVTPALQAELSKMAENNSFNLNDLQPPAPGQKKRKGPKAPAPNEPAQPPQPAN